MQTEEFLNPIIGDNVSGKSIFADGFYRAKVVENKDPDKFGRVKVFIPVLMHTHC